MYVQRLKIATVNFKDFYPTGQMRSLVWVFDVPMLEITVPGNKQSKISVFGVGII